MEPLRMKSESRGIQPENSLFFALGLLTGLAISAAFALGVWALSSGGRQPVAQAAATRSPAVAPAARAVELPTIASAAPARPDESPPIVNPGPKPRARVLIGGSRLSEPDSPPLVPAPPEPARPAAPVIMPERFVLQEPPRQEVRSFVLPTETWFALGEVSAEEPKAAEPVVCRVDRSLGTVLKWAKSPAEASEQAARAGKLVFLIHVSGNFEDPGFT